MPNVQEIFQTYGLDYHKRHSMSPDQYKAMMAIINCRTFKLGGRIEECDKCGHTHILYNSCRNRNCNMCQTFLKTKWIDARKDELLNVPYFHVVFTIPQELNMMMYQNQKIMYKILFDAASETLMELAEDPKYLGAKIGLTSIIHTWGQNLMFHPHIHCIVPSGGLTKDEQFAVGGNNFFIPVKVISSKFRGKFLYFLNKAYTDNKLKFYGDILEYNSDQCFQMHLHTLRNKKWVIYCKETFNGPEAVIEYLGRYTHRIAISNNRILSIDNSTVTFKWKDYKDGKQKIMTLLVDEFIRRFLLHVLPIGLMKIRYHGILANRNKSTKLKKCQIISGYFTAKIKLKLLTAVQIIKLMIGRDITLCPQCKLGTMKTIKVLPAIQNKLSYNCIII